MSNVQSGSSNEVDELKVKLDSTKETLQGEIKVREEVRTKELSSLIFTSKV